MANKIETLDVRGMSIEDIRTLNKNTLSTKALRQAYNRLASAGNKRLRRMLQDQVGKLAPRVEDIKPFSSKGVSDENLSTEFDRVRNFLDPSKRSHTLTGWKQIVKETQKRLNVSRETVTDSEFWKLYRGFEDTETGKQYDSNNLIPMVANAYEIGLRDYKDIKEFIKYEYERQQTEENDKERVNRGFETFDGDDDE